MKSSDSSGGAAVGETSTAADVIHGHVARQQNGDVYDERHGGTAFDVTGGLNSLHSGGYRNTLVEGFVTAVTVGESLSTVSGAHVATTGGLSINWTAPVSVGTLFGWDVEISKSTQTHSTGPVAYEFRRGNTYEATTLLSYELAAESHVVFARNVREMYKGLETIADQVRRDIRTAATRVLGDLKFKIGKNWVVHTNYHRVLADDFARIATPAQLAILDVQPQAVVLRANAIRLALLGGVEDGEGEIRFGGAPDTAPPAA